MIIVPNISCRIDIVTA